MPTISDRDQAISVFHRLFEILLDDPTFATTVREERLSARFVHTKPDFELFVDGEGPVLVDAVRGTPTLTIKMSCDTADALWSGSLLMPVAVALGKIRIRGSVSKVLEFVPLLQPAFDQYAQIREQARAGV